VLFLFLTIIVWNHGRAQNLSGSDSTAKQKTNDSIEIYFTRLNSPEKCTPDSSIHSLHTSLFKTAWEEDLGNSGSAAKSYQYTPEWEIRNRLIIAPVSFLFQPEKIPLFNTTRPYTDLYYKLGSKQQQEIEILHTQNITPVWNIAADYRKSGSPGFYRQQKSNHDQAWLSSNYHSVHDKYHFTFIATYNKLQQDENGGIESEDYLRDVRYNDRRLIPVRFEAMSSVANRSSYKNYFREARLLIQHAILIKRFGKVNLQQLQLEHQLNASFQRFYSKDLQPDSLTYSFTQAVNFSSGDSNYFNYYFRSWGNMLSLKYQRTIADALWLLKTGAGVDRDELLANERRINYTNPFMEFSLMNRSERRNAWNYQFTARSYFQGNLRGNNQIRVQGKKEFPGMLGQFAWQYQHVVHTMAFTQQWYESNYLNLTTEGKKESVQEVSLFYQLANEWFSLRASQYRIHQFIYRDSQLIIRNADKNIALTQCEAGSHLHWRGLHSDSKLLFQYQKEAGPLHLPQWALKTALYIQGRVVQSKLHICSGASLRYRSAFQADEYQPVFYGFSTQYNRTIAQSPALGFFFNWQVKSFRGTISAEEIQQLFSVNRVLYPSYAAPNFNLHFGFHWSFVN